MTIEQTSLLLLLALSGGSITCHRNESKKSPPPPVALTNSAICQKAWKVKLGIAGGYGINGTYLHGETANGPFVYLDPSFGIGTPRTVPPFTRHRLAQYPAVAVDPRELCTSEVVAGEMSVRCLNDSGLPVPVELRLDEVASRLGVSRYCLELENEIGSRNLDGIMQNWKKVLANCSGKAKGQRTEVILELRHPSKSADCGTKGHPTCAQVRLAIPAIGFKKDVGVIWNFPLCIVRDLTSPAGIQVACSDNDISYAEVYHYRNTVFYRIEKDTEQAPNGGGPAMQSIALPCGVEPVFRFRSFEPVERESSN
jgi:hypothetical protein